MTVESLLGWLCFEGEYSIGFEQACVCETQKWQWATFLLYSSVHPIHQFPSCLLFHPSYTFSHILQSLLCQSWLAFILLYLCCPIRDCFAHNQSFVFGRAIFLFFWPYTVYCILYCTVPSAQPHISHKRTIVSSLPVKVPVTIAFILNYNYCICNWYRCNYQC